jgi:hypothetical protein
MSTPLSREVGALAAQRLLSSLESLRSESIDGADDDPDSKYWLPGGICQRVKPTLLVNRTNGHSVMWAGCKAARCPVCGPRRAAQQAVAVGYVASQHERSRFLTLTQAPERWETRRQKMADYKLKLKRRDINLEWAWVTEQNPQGTGWHIHATCVGDYLPQAVMQDLWGAIVDVRSNQGLEVARGQYAVKQAIKHAQYSVKHAADQYDTLLAANGGRWWHTSRGYYGGHGWKTTYKAARYVMLGRHPEMWSLATDWEQWAYLEGRSIVNGMELPVKRTSGQRLYDHPKAPGRF